NERRVMPAVSVSVDNISGLLPDRIGSPGAAGAAQTAPRKDAERAAVEGYPSRPADFAPVEGFLHLLARAIRQFHTYPPTSPLCTGAIAACHKALTSIEYRDRLVLRVTPNEIIVEEVHLGAGTIVEDEIVRRLVRV